MIASRCHLLPLFAFKRADSLSFKKDLVLEHRSCIAHTHAESVPDEVCLGRRARRIALQSDGHQGKNPASVDSTCVLPVPGFLVQGAAGTPAPELHPGSLQFSETPRCP